MASRLPLVLVNGELQQLQAGDTLPGGGAATWYSGTGLPTGYLDRSGYVSNGDANGIMYLAGQNFNPAGTWTNPHTAGYVTVTRSSDAGGTGADLVSRSTSPTDCKTNNVANSWIAIDLGSTLRSAVLTKYSMQNRGSNRAIRTWKLQGSNNPASNSVADLAAATWTDIDIRSGDTTMADSADAWATFTIIGTPARYRWFRILQNGTNAQGDNFLCVAEVELYGTIYGVGSTLGVVGDYYVDTASKNIYYQTVSGWGVIFNILVDAVGSGNPTTSGSEKEGDLYFNSITGDIWIYHSAAWTLYGANAYRLQGVVVSGTSETTAPNDGDVVTYSAAGTKWMAKAGGSALAYIPSFAPPVFL